MELSKIITQEIDHSLRGFLKENNISHLDMIKMLMQHISINISFYNDNKKMRDTFNEFEKKKLDKDEMLEGAFLCFYESMRLVLEFDKILKKTIRKRETT